MLKYVKAILYLPTLIDYLRRQKDGPGDDEVALRAAVDWLLRAQHCAGKNGYAHSYHFAAGWQEPYPETTGYIIPSLIAANRSLNDKAIDDSVHSALGWLVRIQAAEGYFTDIQGAPQVFDTGQILIGLNECIGQSPELREAATKAAEWLCGVQEEDGSFIRHAYNNRPHSYYSRVGAALVRAGQLLGRAEFIRAGIRNLDWTLQQQDDSGFFAHMAFDDNPPFLHNMVYVMEGLLDAADLLGDQKYSDAAVRFAAGIRSAPTADGIPRSQYTQGFHVANSEYCMTGVAQWAGVCYRLAGHDAGYIAEADRALDFVRSRQIVSPNRNIHGALTGSEPFSGVYLRFSCPNWGVKFFTDALLARRSMRS